MVSSSMAEDAALDEAGRVAELSSAVETDPYPPLLRPRIEQMPAEQSGRWWGFETIEGGGGHGGSPFRSALAQARCQHGVSRRQPGSNP
jgi:hypothetical protein